MNCQVMYGENISSLIHKLGRLELKWMALVILWQRLRRKA